MKYNNLLERQIKKHFPKNVSLDDPGIASFLNVINQSYQSFERDKSLSERASEINEEEYIEINKSLNEEINIRKFSIDNLKKTISLITDEPLDFSSNDLMSISNYLNQQVHSRKKAETIFTSLINNIQTGVLLKDLDGKIIFVNKLFCEIFEINDEPKNIIDKNFNEFKSTIRLKLKDPERFTIDVENKLTAKKIDLLNIVELKNGRTLEQNYIPIIQEDTCVGHLWNYYDITERKEKEEIIRKNEILLTTSQEIAHIGSWEYNILTEKVEWTKEIYSIRGIDPEIEKANYSVFINGIHPEDKEMVNAKLMEAIKNTISFNIHYRIIKPDGDIRIVNDIGNTIVNAEGKNELIRGTIQDVTLRKKIEQEILQQKQFTETIITASPSLTYVFDIVEGTNIGQGHFGEILPGEGEILLHQIIQIEQVGGDGVDLVRHQRLRIAERHRMAQKIEDSRDIGPIRPDRAQRPIPGQRALAAREFGPAIDPLAEFAMTRSTALLIQRLPLARRAPALRQPLAVGPDIDIPGREFRLGGCTADPQRGRLREGGDEQQNEASPPPHSRSPRWAGSARSGCRCCDRSSSPPGFCATPPWSAARSRCCHAPATAAASPARATRYRHRTASSTTAAPARRAAPRASSARHRATHRPG